LQAWRERYERSETSVGTFDLAGVEWRMCLSSDLPRASITARAVFPGPIEYTAQLREGRFEAFQTGRLRLPVKAWEWLLRLSWMSGHRSQRACRDDLRQRVLGLAERLGASAQDTLIVSHAGVMACLSDELRRRGFLGPRLRLPRHATTYVYERRGAGVTLVNGAASRKRI
jgi:broad specificity phosphatase PhoE